MACLNTTSALVKCNQGPLIMMNPQEQLIPRGKVAVTLHYQDRKTQTIDMVVRK